jgi:hypothetical protein
MRPLCLNAGRLTMLAGIARCKVSADGKGGMHVDLAADYLGAAIVTGLFAVLKIARVTDWPWAAVTAPWWGAVLLSLASAALVLVLAAGKSAPGIRGGDGRDGPL